MKAQADIHRLTTKSGEELIIGIERRKQSKHLRLRFHPKHYHFILSAPQHAPQKQIIAFAQRYSNMMHQYVASLPEKQMVQRGDVQQLLGEPYYIPAHQTNDDLPRNARCLPIRKQQSVKSAVQQLMLHYCTDRVSLLLSLFPELQQHPAPPKLTIKDTHARWGSCSVDGELMLASQLVFAPRDVLHYVIAHECSHLIHHNHSAKFWRLVEQLHPQYTIHANWLKEHGNSLFSYQFSA